MDNAKKVSPTFQASVRLAAIRSLQSAEKSGFGIGLTKESACVTLGGRTKPDGTALGRDSFPASGRKLSTTPRMALSTSQM